MGQSVNVKRALAVLAATGLCVATAFAGRYEQFTKKAAQGRTMEVAAATLFGGDGIEEFVAAGELANGGIVAFGNLWGPDAPRAGGIKVMGRGEHRGLDPYAGDRPRRKRLDPDNPDRAGMIVTFSPDLGGIVSFRRFDSGVASIATGLVDNGGKALYVAGRCGPDFDSLLDETDSVYREAYASLTEFPHKGVVLPHSSYLMKLEDGSVKWIRIFEGIRTPAPELWQDNEGNVYFQVNGLKKVSADGRTIRQPYGKGTSNKKIGILTIDPRDGSFVLGGDRNTHTGREPWRQPFLYGYSPDGTRQWKIWEWNSRRVGSDKYRLVSDSAAREADFAPNGDLVVGGWSDGGNSVFTRQPTDLDQGVPDSGWGVSAWGMKNANSLTWLMRLDPQTHRVTDWTRWVCYIPQDYHAPRYRNAPNFASLDDLKVLPTGQIATVGRAATGLIQTPNAFWEYPGDGKKSGGPFVTVWNGDFTDLLFSSYLPACEDPAIAPAPKNRGLIVVSRSRGEDDRMGSSPAKNAFQTNFGGQRDGHILLLTLPE